MDGEEKRKQLERAILLIIAEKLQNGQMDMERAQAIAKMLLEKLHPPITLERIYAIAPTLDDQFAELAQAVLPLVHEHDEKVRAVVSQHAEKLIKSGQLEEAHTLLKQTLDKGEQNGR